MGVKPSANSRAGGVTDVTRCVAVSHESNRSPVALLRDEGQLSSFSLCLKFASLSGVGGHMVDMYRDVAVCRVQGL